MRAITRTEFVGEDCGPIDWTHPLAADKPAHWREAEQDPEAFMLLETGMFTPRKVYKLCMYDGWPYWTPTPAIYRDGPLGPEWSHFNSYGIANNSLYRKEPA